MLFVAVSMEQRQKKEEKIWGNNERKRERNAENRFPVPDNSVPQGLTSQLVAFGSSEHSHAAGTCFKSQPFDVHRGQDCFLYTLIHVYLSDGRSEKGLRHVAPGSIQLRMQSQWIARFACH